jgi:mRNA interferase MazF
MIHFSQHDIVVVKFPFASSNTYKARPAVVISNDFFNTKARNTLLIMAISSQISSKLEFEPMIEDWQDVGLLKSSIIKSAVTTIEKEYVLTKLGHLSSQDIHKLEALLQTIC